MRSNLRTYQKVNHESGLSVANPHTVILMLFNGILENMSIAKGAIERKDLALKSSSLSKSINILRSLVDSLDEESEPKISRDFSVLYNYCIEQLSEVSVSLDTSVIDNTIELLKPLRDAWKDVSEEDKKAGFGKINDRDKSKTLQAAGH